MADKKISELTELTTPDGTEELVVNDSGVSKKIQIDNLIADNGLSGDKIDGGTISNFTSTGIDDNATSTAITIDASENVGIGTSSPATALDVRLGGSIEGTVSGGVANFVNSASAGDSAVISITAGTTGYSSINFADSADKNIGQISYNHSNNSLGFRNNDVSDRMTINSSGNVGIGTSSPQGNLHISGGTGDASLILQADTDNSGETDQPRIELWQDGSNAWNAIGALDPTADNALVLANSIGNAGGIIFKTNTDNAGWTAATERMRIDSSGNVGIGVTPKNWSSSYIGVDIGNLGFMARTGGDNCHILSNSYYDGSAWKYKTTNTATKLDTDSGRWTFAVAPSGTADSAISWTTVASMHQSGVFSLGNSTNPGDYKLNVHQTDSSKYGMSSYVSGTGSGLHFRIGNDYGTVGSIQTSGGGTSFNTSSDYRLKENVVPMTGSIDRLKELNPSRFNFIVDADKTVDGFLAHEAQEVVPEAVTGTKDAMMTEEYEVEPAVKETITIPAVEAVEATYDDEGNVLTEAIEAQEERTEERVVTEAVMGEREVPDYQGIDQSKLVPLLVASLQEAVEKIEALEARVTALEV